MNGWVLYAGKPVTELFRLKETAQKAGVNISIIDPGQVEIFISDERKKEAYILNEWVPLPDFAIAAFLGEADYHNLSLLKQLEAQGVLCLNRASTLMKTNDKLSTLQLLLAHGIAVPKTLLLSFPYDLDFIKKEFGYPVVIKVIDGAKGDGVALIDSQKNMENMLQMFEATRIQEKVLIQEFIESSKGRDVRVLIVNYQPVAAMLRSNMKQDGFKSNYSAGGSVESFALTPEIEELTIRVSKILDLNIGGLDLLFTEDGFKICEANSIPGFEGMEKACDINVPGVILKSIAGQLSTRNKISTSLK